MMIYSAFRALLFRLEPELAHHLALGVLRYLPEFFFPKLPEREAVQAMSLSFPHPIGLAAGFDKNGRHLDDLAKLGFSFIEVGTVTPLPQMGNPKPRLFRLPKQRALLNRLGFNNLGVAALVDAVNASRYRGILGINIGKNKSTPLDRAADDYLQAFQAVYAQASYVTVNISSPNTEDLRRLQQGEYFDDLVRQLKQKQSECADRFGRYVPLVIKVSPDENDENLKRMASVAVALGIDGLMATNTLMHDPKKSAVLPFKEAGGISGQPLFQRATETLKLLRREVGKEMTLIGVGGIDTPARAKEKLLAGADLLQVYTGLIYQGPFLVHQLLRGLGRV